jgi:hypothetical protein
MKKNRTIALLVILLILLAGYFYFRHSVSTIKRELRDFAVQDTAAVSKIFMVNKENVQILLEREDGTWKVNGKYPARKDATDLLLKTLHRLDVKSPVSKASFDNVVKLLAANHVKVEIYSGKKKPDKVIYVGGPTQDYFGTYMMLENSSTPFIMHIPGFSGYLTTRFFMDENEWRDHGILRYQFHEIASVDLENIRQPEKSFRIENSGDNQFRLIRLMDKEPVAHFDTLRAKEYLAQFMKVSFERIAAEVLPEVRDSILSTNPIYRITVNDIHQKTTLIEAFLRPNFMAPASESAIPPEFDPDRMYGRINKDSTLVIIQYFTFDPIFMELDYFLSDKTNR